MSPPQGESWHIPFMWKFRQPVATSHLHVIFLQRMSEEAREQVLSNIRDTDREWAAALDVPALEPRTLVGRPWIRDYRASSAVILKIAEDASTPDYNNRLYSNYFFADSGWEAGNVIAARWEGSGENRRLNAVRVPMNIANVLLTTCDANEGFTLSRVLGEEVYDEAKVDFYEDSVKATITQPTASVEKKQLFSWPDFLPQDLKIATEKLYVLSLRTLTDSEIQQLRANIAGDEGTAADDVTIYNWEGDPPPRRDLRHILRHIYDNSPEEDRTRLAFFVDNILLGPDGEPQIVASLQWRPKNGGDETKIAPVPNESVLQIWKELNEGQGGEELMENHSDIWSTEAVEDLREKTLYFPADAHGAPVFFLQPFTRDEERQIRSALRVLDEVEEDEDWGKEFNFFGYPWPDGTSKRSMQDLGDLFSTCDPWSPAYDRENPGPYSFAGYPREMIIIDEKCLDPHDPQVILATSMDFNSELVDDTLGWIYGYAPARSAYIGYTNLWLGNMGPDAFIEDMKHLWLTDLKEFKENEWAEEHAGDEE